MCQMYIQQTGKFDQYPPLQTFDTIVKKNQITTKTLSKLDLEPKCQGHSRNPNAMNFETKTCHPKKIEHGSLRKSH